MTTKIHQATFEKVYEVWNFSLKVIFVLYWKYQALNYPIGIVPMYHNVTKLLGARLKNDELLKKTAVASKNELAQHINISFAGLTFSQNIFV